MLRDANFDCNSSLRCFLVFLKCVLYSRQPGRLPAAPLETLVARQEDDGWQIFSKSYMLLTQCFFFSKCLAILFHLVEGLAVSVLC